jgi:hypothetical protein
MNKNVKYYERILRKKVELRTGSDFEEWLEPQLHASAMCWQMLEKVQDELLGGKLCETRQGSKDQWYSELNPLMPTYKELQRTMVLHYEALGLNYKSTPSKIVTETKKGASESDPLMNILKEAKEATT